MSSSSSPIELTILSVRPQDSHVHHAASHVYAVVKKKKKKKKCFFSFFILSFNLVKVQDCWMLKFKEILGYITWSSSGGQRERERERERQRERERERERERKKERGGVNSFMAFVFSTC